MHKQLLIKKILRYTRNLLIFFFASTLLAVIVYRFMPVYVTPLMVIRSVQQIFSGDKPTRQPGPLPFRAVHAGEQDREGPSINQNSVKGEHQAPRRPRQRLSEVQKI